MDNEVLDISIIIVIIVRCVFPRLCFVYSIVVFTSHPLSSTAPVKTLSSRDGCSLAEWSEHLAHTQVPYIPQTEWLNLREELFWN